jgi:hypothetical protein
MLEGMLKIAVVSSLLAGVLSLTVACGDDGDGSGGSGGTTSTGGTTSQGGTGGTATGTTDGGGGAGGIGGAGTCDDLLCNECSDCAVADLCMAEDSACDGNAECGAYGVCLAGCGDAACFMQCAMMHPDGVAEFDALIACICGTCSTSCSANPLCPPG